MGVPAAAAVAQGPLLTVFSKGLDLLLLLITARLVGQAVDLDEIDVGPVVQLLGFVIVAVIIGIVVVFAVPKLRARVMPHIKEGLSAVKGAVTDPERLLKIAGGTAMQKILFALTLSASVAAYGSLDQLRRGDLRQHGDLAARWPHPRARWCWRQRSRTHGWSDRRWRPPGASDRRRHHPPDGHVVPPAGVRLLRVELAHGT